MKIISVELIGFKRIALNGVTHFQMKMSEVIQLILGTNGSGKSSLLSELSPLPGENSDYTRDGLKNINITDNGNSYILTSKFNPKQEHSFFKNGENLNVGGTITVQKELVKQEFGITPQIRDLLVGFETFHDMSASKRREWFTLLSPINYDYALGVFNKLKAHNSYIAGALKHAKKRLVTESGKVISIIEEEKLRKDIDFTNNELTLLYEHKAPVERPIKSYREQQHDGMEELSRLSNKLLRMRLIAPYGAHSYGVNPTHGQERDDWFELIQPSFTSMIDIDNFINTIKNEISVKETLISKEVSEHAKIDETVKILIKTGEEGVSALREKIMAIEEARDYILSNRKLPIECADPVNALSSLNVIYDLLQTTFSSIPENEDKKYSISRLTELRQTLIRLKDINVIRKAEHVRLSVQKTHLETHKSNGDSVCPKCNHRWIAGFSDDAYEKIVTAVAEKEYELEKEEKEINEITENIESIQEYSDIYRDFSRCVSEWKSLKPFWDYLLDGEYVTRSPRKALSILNTFKDDLELAVTSKQYEKDAVSVYELIRAAEQVGSANLTDSRIKLEECNSVISNLTSELVKLKSTLTEYVQYRRQLAEANDLGERINVLTILMENTTSEMIEMMRRDTVEHCIRQLQHSISLKQEALSAAILQKEIVADLEDQVAKLTVEDDTVKLMIKCLSPTDGLIAEGLFGFIHNFVGQMNNLIRKVWTYPLLIQDCGLSGDTGTELDYKFPLMVQSKDNVVPDVKLGSDGMVEIIDLAFKVVAMRYLGLSESPLVIDEFGRCLDEQHRTASMNIVKTLMDTQPFTQLFMVSHYESFHGAFTNAEICVLDKSNITIPSIYNLHVSIS